MDEFVGEGDGGLEKELAVAVGLGAFGAADRLGDGFVGAAWNGGEEE